MLLVRRVGQHLEQVLVPRGSPAVLRRADPFAVDAAGFPGARPDDPHLVPPPVAEVIDVAERVRQVAQPHPGLVLLDVREVAVGHAVRRVIGHELVQVGITPADRGLEHVVQLGQGGGGQGGPRRVPPMARRRGG